MRIEIIILFVFFSAFEAFGCECVLIKFTDEMENSDLIFQGEVKKSYETENGMLFEFEHDKIWKGEGGNLIQIETGIGGGDCGIKFITGKTYIVYSKNNKTDSCHRNSELSKTYDGLKLDYHFDVNLKETSFVDPESKLNRNESDYLNRQFDSIVEGFDFSDKSILFTVKTNLITKKDWYKSNKYHEKPVVELVILNEDEKGELGYDAILVSWNKMKLTSRMKKRILRKAKRKTK